MICDDMFVLNAEKLFGSTEHINVEKTVVSQNETEHIHKQLEQTGAPHYFESIVPQVLQYIDKNLAESLSSGDLAKQCFYNPSYFSRMFHACFGITFTKYVRRRRVDEAMQLLSSTNMEIDMICQQIGYSDRKIFYKYFKQRTGISPGRFRKEHIR